MKLIQTIGNTPLLALDRLAASVKPAIYAKAEFMNPSGSIKDRAAANMIQDGLASGKLAEGKTILDATSGNTGIAYAMLGASLGFKVKLFLPANASAERKQIMRAFGAEIVETDPLEGTDGSYLAAQAAYEKFPDRYFYPDQYNNPANWQAHFNGTGLEIFRQTNAKVTHFVASTGTTGTLMGTARRLKKENPNIKIITVQPDSPMHGIEGTKHLASTISPGIYDASIPDGLVEVSTEEAYLTSKALAEKEGIFVGISSGANVAGALKIAQELGKDAVIATILCDNGFRYLSTDIWKSRQ
ncbi:MAG: PLP-dependent cysteine synthase family protein [Oxalobacter sp.]